MKTCEQLRSALEEVFTQGLNLAVYIGTGDAAARQYRRADFDDDAMESVCKTYVAGVRSFFQNEELNTLPLSGMDHRGDTLLHYDLAEQPPEFAQLRALRDGPEPALFSFDETDLSDVRSIVLKIASPAKIILFFKKFYPVSLVKRDQILLYKSGTRFGIINTDILKISAGFEVMLVDDEYYINDFTKFEKAFSFAEISNRSMQAVTMTILDMNIVSDPKGHLAAFQAPKKDILRAAKSPVLGYNAQSILDFVQTKQARIGLKVVNGRLELSSRESVKRLFKLLNDDYLTSGLTTFDYETLAKNKLT